MPPPAAAAAAASCRPSQTFRRRGEALRSFCFRQLLRRELLNVLGGLTLHRPLPRSLEQRLHLRSSPDDLGRGHLVRRRGQSGRAPGDPQSSVEPIASSPQDVEGLVLTQDRGSSAHTLKIEPKSVQIRSKTDSSTFRDFQKARSSSSGLFRRVLWPFRHSEISRKPFFNFAAFPRFSKSQTAFFRLVSPRFVTKNGLFDLQRKNSCMFKAENRSISLQSSFFDPERKNSCKFEAENRSISLQSSFFDRREKTAAFSRLKIAQFRSKVASSIQREKQLHVRSRKNRSTSL